MNTTSCLGCACTLMSDSEWRAAPKDRRASWGAANTRRHEGRGLCNRCYHAARSNGTLDDYPRTNKVWVDVLEEWQFMADPSRTNNENVRHLAPRLGMSEEALHHALVVNKVRSPFDSNGRPKVAA